MNVGFKIQMNILFVIMLYQVIISFPKFTYFSFYCLIIFHFFQISIVLRGKHYTNNKKNCVNNGKKMHNLWPKESE